ncbi:MAG: UPF0182 family protein [Gemmatimonadota bacterium]|nr:MAG: UPF0182 family protein [Gemmatimonadota bacterium]
MPRRLVILIALVAVIFLAATGLPALISLVANWYWFDAVGFESVFFTVLWTKLGVGVVVGFLAFAFVAFNLRFTQRGLIPEGILASISSSLPKVDPTRLLRILVWPVALLFGLGFGAAASGAWLTLQQFLHRTAFGVTDPVFGRDVGYYVFTLPAISVVVGLAISVTVLTLALTALLYSVRRDVVIHRRRVMIERTAELHIAVLIALLFLGTAVSVWFVHIPSLLYSTTGPLLGASYSDLAVQVPVLRISAVVALLAAVFVLLGTRNRHVVRNTAIGVLVYIGVGILGALASSAIQRLVVIPNELVKEAPQLEHHIAATRRAWGIDEVAIRDLSGESRLTLNDIQANRGTIENVRLWDREPLLQTFGQLQEIRTYYDFVSVDDDRYWIDGKYRQVLLSPRELNTASLPTRTFINERLTFTHGMGLTLGPVNAITQEGLPVLFIKDLPPASDVSLQVTRPGIYYGEISSDYVFVNTGQEEFDYPAGEGNVFTEYVGTGGVAVSSLLRRAILSTHFGSLKILFSQDITGESRVLYHRNVRERAAKALPFLLWDGDPYLVITDAGQLKWILDAYTASTRYPYSQRLSNGTNYMRNSVKVVIDAYDGDIKAYVAEPDDPIVQTYGKIFDGIFVPIDEMPADIRAHVRYPEDLFRVQTTLYTTYHMSEPEVFYHREDQWQIPTLTRGEEGRDRFLRHIILKLPGETQEEYIIMAPFTPRGKDNLSAWMVARNDGERYGQIVVYRFPRQSLVFGPTQVVNRINQDTEISRQVSLWDQRGSQVIRGNLLVIPIEESLIFVQALYLRAEGGRIPELKRVIVAYENQVVMEETLERGLERLFGGMPAGETRPALPVAAAAAAGAPATADVAGLIQQAAQHYEAAIEAQRRGDWTRYGEEMRMVGELLRRLEELAGGS